MIVDGGIMSPNAGNEMLFKPRSLNFDPGNGNIEKKEARHTCSHLACRNRSNVHVLVRRVANDAAWQDAQVTSKKHEQRAID